MKKYRLTSADGEVDMTLSYGEDDFIRSWIINKSCSVEWWRRIWNFPPLTTGSIWRWGQEKDITVTEVPADLSFPIFWDAYAHKVGNKGKTEKLWDRLSEADRVAALAGLPRYESFLATRPTMEKAFAETWLRNRRWES